MFAGHTRRTNRGRDLLPVSVVRNRSHVGYTRSSIRRKYIVFIYVNHCGPDMMEIMIVNKHMVEPRKRYKHHVYVLATTR